MRPTDLPGLPAPVGVALALATLAAVGCGAESAREATELLVEGGEIQLRDTLRPAHGPPRVLIIALDGVGRRALAEALDRGRMPRLEAVAGRPGDDDDRGRGWLAPPVVSVLPSITLAAWTTVFTGRPPAETGVPGNEWFDRRAEAFRAPAPVSVDANEQALAVFSEGLLGDWITAPTLYELADVRSYVSMQHVHRGADLLTIASAEDLAKLLGGFVRGVGTDAEVDREVYATVDRSSAEGAAAAIRSHGAPDLQVVYFPGLDLYTHAAPRPLADQQGYLADVVDPAIGSVLDAWRQAGALEGTWILVIADHGHTPVPSGEGHAMRADGPASVEAVLRSGGWRVRPPGLGDVGDHQAVVALQGAFAYIYLADRRTCPGSGDRCRWDVPPLPEDVDGVASLLLQAGESGQEPGGPAAGPLAGALETVLVPRRDSAGSLLRIEQWTRNGPGPLSYAPGDTVMLRFEERLRWLLDGPRGHLAGDVIVVGRSGAWVPHERRYYFSHPYRSWHGSAHPADSHTPLLVARSDLDRARIRELVEPRLPPDPTQLDLVELILGLLDGGG